MDQTNYVNVTQTINILIVDDDIDTCNMLDMLFSRHGYRTSIVYSGEEAVNRVREGGQDIVIMDVLMPDMNGWEAYKRVRTVSNIPVLFLTAISSSEYAARALEIGVNDFIKKPFHSEELLARIGALLRNRQAVDSKPAIIGGNWVIHPKPLEISVVIPAYNEARFIGSTVLEARKYGKTIIVVDDGSSDDTAEIAEAAGAVVVRHTSNKGKGAALNTGFCKARELSSHVVVTLDADGQHLPEEVLQVVQPVLDGKADIVIGSRYLKLHSKVPLNRIWGHWFFNHLTRLASGTASTDSQSGFRAFSPAAVDAISFCSNGFSVESEMQFIAHENGLRLLEVPITILYTDKPKRSVISQGMSVLGGVFKLMGQYRPLFYFGLPGFMTMILGILAGLGVIVRYQDMHQFAIGYAMISILLCVIGMVLFSTGFTLHSIRGLLSDMLNHKHVNR